MNIYKKILLLVSTLFILSGCFNQPDIVQLQTIHSGFNLGDSTSLSLCGVDLNYDDSFKPLESLANLKKQYNLDSFDQEGFDLHLSLASQYIPRPELPASIDGYFMYTFSPSSNKELEYKLTNLHLTEAEKTEIKSILAFRESSGLSFHQAVSIVEKYESDLEGINKKNDEIEKSILHEITLSLQPKYEVAACLYGTDEYMEYGRMRYDPRLGKAMADLYEAKFNSLQEEVYISIIKELATKGIDYDDVVIGEDILGRPGFVIKEDGKKVAFVIGYYSLHQKMFRYALAYLFEEDQSKNFQSYIYN